MSASSPTSPSRLPLLAALTFALFALSCTSSDASEGKTESQGDRTDAVPATVQSTDWEKDLALFEIGERERIVEKDYKSAIDQYEQIRRAAPVYEKALVMIGVCRFRMGEQDEALRIFVDYLEKYVTAEVNSTGGSATRDTHRLDAMATAAFYRTLIEYNKGQYQSVIDHASDYYKKYPEQAVMARWTVRLVGNSLTKTGKIEEAKAYLETAGELLSKGKHTEKVLTKKELLAEMEAALDADAKEAADDEDR